MNAESMLIMNNVLMHRAVTFLNFLRLMDCCVFFKLCIFIFSLSSNYFSIRLNLW